MYTITGFCWKRGDTVKVSSNSKSEILRILKEWVADDSRIQIEITKEVYWFYINKDGNDFECFLQE